MNQMSKLSAMLEKAQQGGWSLWKLNFALGFAIPFNKKHGFKVTRVTPDSVQTAAAYQRRNFNHIRGIHACAIATIAEFATGLALLRKVDAAQYRLIMSKMEVEYFFQARKPITATAQISAAEIEETVTAPLQTQESVFKTLEARITDADQNHIATARITWQFKPWGKVKTKA